MSGQLSGSNSLPRMYQMSFFFLFGVKKSEKKMEMHDSIDSVTHDTIYQNKIIRSKGAIVTRHEWPHRSSNTSFFFWHLSCCIILEGLEG